jgi:hypothetical protein
VTRQYARALRTDGEIAGGRQRLTGIGRPRIRGPVLRLKDPATHEIRDRHLVDDGSSYGRITTDRLPHVHLQPAAADATVLRVAVAHLPRHESHRHPFGGSAMAARCRSIYVRSGSGISGGLRSSMRQEQGWTLAQPCSPIATTSSPMSKPGASPAPASHSSGKQGALSSRLVHLQTFWRSPESTSTCHRTFWSTRQLGRACARQKTSPRPAGLPACQPADLRSEKGHTFPSA